MSSGIWLVGGGGHCRACIDVVLAEGKHAIAGIVDAPERRGMLVMGYPVAASDSDLASLAAGGAAFLITLGQIESASGRIRLYQTLKSASARLPAVVSPFARMAQGAEAGEGTVVMHHALLNSGARVGRNCIVNSRALVEHDAVIGDHVHVSTGALVNGGVEVGEGAFLGSGCVIGQGIRIAPGAVIGAGSVVIRDIPEPGVYAGNPARKAWKA